VISTYLPVEAECTHHSRHATRNAVSSKHDPREVHYLPPAALADVGMLIPMPDLAAAAVVFADLTRLCLSGRCEPAEPTASRRLSQRQERMAARPAARACIRPSTGAPTLALCRTMEAGQPVRRTRTRTVTRLPRA
jgi:hypothetical protein